MSESISLPVSIPIFNNENDEKHNRKEYDKLELRFVNPNDFSTVVSTIIVDKSNVKDFNWQLLNKVSFEINDSTGLVLYNADLCICPNYSPIETWLFSGQYNDNDWKLKLKDYTLDECHFFIDALLHLRPLSSWLDNQHPPPVFVRLVNKWFELVQGLKERDEIETEEDWLSFMDNIDAIVCVLYYQSLFLIRPYLTYTEFRHGFDVCPFDGSFCMYHFVHNNQYVLDHSFFNRIAKLLEDDESLHAKHHKTQMFEEFDFLYPLVTLYNDKTEKLNHGISNKYTIPSVPIFSNTLKSTMWKEGDIVFKQFRYEFINSLFQEFPFLHPDIFQYERKIGNSQQGKYKFKCIVAGGAVLSHLTDRPCRDLDLFVFSNGGFSNFSPMPKGFRSLQLYLRSLIDTISLFYDEVKFVQTGTSVMSLIVNNKDSENQVNKTIQFIYIDCEEAYEVIHNFDLDISKCFFDGYNVHCTSSFLEAVQTQTCNQIDWKHVTCNRLKKILMKGFQISVFAAPLLDSVETFHMTNKEKWNYDKDPLVCNETEVVIEETKTLSFEVKPDELMNQLFQLTALQKDVFGEEYAGKTSHPNKINVNELTASMNKYDFLSNWATTTYSVEVSDIHRTERNLSPPDYFDCWWLVKPTTTGMNYFLQGVNSYFEKQVWNENDDTVLFQTDSNTRISSSQHTKSFTSYQASSSLQNIHMFLETKHRYKFEFHLVKRPEYFMLHVIHLTILN